MIEQGVVQNVVETANSRIVDIVSEFVQLRKRGINYIGLCPFHQEKTGSFNVSPTRGIFKCFGCGVAGNAVKFIMEHEHCAFPEAIKYLGRKFNIEVVDTQLTEEQIQLQSDRESMMALNDFAANHFIDNLWNTDEGQAIGLTYFRERGFRDDTIRRFSLGYAPRKRTTLLEVTLARGFKQEFLEKTGLATFGENNYRSDRFFDRVIFPIKNLSGKIIAFGGRVLQKSDKTAKYINSPESELYHKSDVVYGLFEARTAIVKANLCLLVEGYTDVISMSQAGIENVVASCGTSLTENQILLIKRFTPNITVVYDGDAAGIKASMRGIDMMLEQGINVRVVGLPDGEDPDSFAKANTADFCQKYFEENQVDFIHFKVNLLLADAGDDPAKRAELINNIVGSIAKVQDKILRDVYLQDCSKIMNISIDTLTSVIQKLLILDSANKRERIYDNIQQREYQENLQRVEQQSGIQTTDKKNPFQTVETELLRLFVKYPQAPFLLPTGQTTPLADYIIAQLDQEKKYYTTTDPVFLKIIDSYTRVEDKSIVDSTFFVNQADTDVSTRVAQLLTADVEESAYHKRFRTNITAEQDLLADIVPRLLNEIRFLSITQKIDSLKQSLQKLESTPESTDAPNDDREAQIEAVLEELSKWNRAKLAFSHRLGNRTVIKK